MIEFLYKDPAFAWYLCDRTGFRNLMLASESFFYVPYIPLQISYPEDVESAVDGRQPALNAGGAE